MKFDSIFNVLWLILLILFLGGTVAQLSARLKHKTVVYDLDRTSLALATKSSRVPILRAHAMLGSACILLAAFWGFDALLAWWMYVEY